MGTKKEFITRRESAFPGAEDTIAAILADYRVTRETDREGDLHKRIGNADACQCMPTHQPFSPFFSQRALAALAAFSHFFR